MYITVTGKNDPGGMVEIYWQAPGSSSWNGPYSTSTTETVLVPVGSNVKYVFVPDNGFGFYEAVGTVTITTTAYEFTDVTSPITETAYFPVKLTILHAELWDYITTSHEYYASFVCELAFANNDTPVPPSIASELVPYMKLYIYVVPENNYPPASGTQGISQHGSVLYLIDKEFFTVYDPNGLETKYATINFTSPDPKLYDSKFDWSMNDWSWGIALTFSSEDSYISWSLPTSIGYTLNGRESPDTLSTWYFPSGASVTVTDSPIPGYAFTGWLESVRSSSGAVMHESSSTSDTITVNLPSTSFSQAYTGPFYYLTSTTAPTTITFNVWAPSGAVGSKVTVYLTFPDGSTQSQSTNLELPHSGSAIATATLKWAEVPEGSYSWYISPPSLSYSTLFGTVTVPANPKGGSFALSGTNNGTVVESITYTAAVYNVTFTEKGLPQGVTWSVTFDSVRESNISPNPIVFTGVPQDTTYSYSAESPIMNGNSIEYQATNAQGTVSVGVTDATQSINYRTFYYVTAGYSGGRGTVNPSAVWVPAGSTETFEFTPEEDYYLPKPYLSYVSTTGSLGVGSISETTSGGTWVYSVPVKVNSPGSVLMNAQWFNFTEYVSQSGIPSDGYWEFEVYENGKLVSTSISGSSVTSTYFYSEGFDYADNSYVKTELVFPVVQHDDVYYVPSISSTSTVTVVSETSSSVTFEITANNENNSHIISVTYTPYYALTISPGSSGSISWSVLYGSFYGQASGVVNAGGSQTAYVAEGTVVELADNPESGYAFNGWSLSGSYVYYGGYGSSSNPTEVQNYGGSGSITSSYRYRDYLAFDVSSSEDISFTISLNNGQSWSGNTLTAPSHTFNLPPGTYSWSISPVTYQYAQYGVMHTLSATPSSGAQSPNATVQISYIMSSETISYTWAESGLPYGTQWSVTVTPGGGNSETYTTTGSSITETFAYGPTYSWVASASGYSPTTSSGSGSFATSGSCSITFYSNPSVSISAYPASGQAPLQVTYTAYVSGGSGSFEYDFEYETAGGSFSWSGWQSSNTFSYTYHDSGVYSTAVEVEDTQTGATAMSGYTPVTITLPPLEASISASPTSGSSPLTVYFSASISGGNGTYSYEWIFGDGSVQYGGTYSSSINTVHTYSSPGTYWAELWVSSSDGNQQAYSNEIQVSVYGTLSITSFSASPSTVTQGQSIKFSWSLSGGESPYLVSITDSAGNDIYTQDTSSTSGSVSYTYSNAGTYTVTLTVTDSVGNQASKSVKVTVNAQSETYSVTFTESGLPSNDGFGNPVTWYVKINGQQYSAQAGQCITVSGLKSGQSYSWSVENPVYVRANWHHTAKYYASPSSGTVSGSTTIQIQYKDPPATPLNFIVSALYKIFGKMMSMFYGNSLSLDLYELS